MAYYWVNKSERYKTKDGSWAKAPQGMLGNYLWAPLQNKSGGPPQHHWTILNKIKPGDCFFISVNSVITAVATAKAYAVVEPAPIDFAAWSGDGYKVIVEYQPLEDRLPVSNFYEQIKDNLPQLYSPLNIDGKANQGYCFLVGDIAGEYIKNLIVSRERNIVFKGFSEEGPQAEYESEDPFSVPKNEEDGREKILKEVNQRRGQPRFRSDLLEIYENRCAISGSRAISVLEAAHIVPYRGESTNHLSNGLILRADIHTLFDRNLIKVSSKDYLVSIDESLKGSEYEQYAGRRLRLPKENHPSKEALEYKQEQSAIK